MSKSEIDWEKNKDKKIENNFINGFIKIFDHIIWYIVLIVFMLCMAYSTNQEKQIHLTGTLQCSEVIK
ncbi:MAG: hypothetical protein IKO49_01840 [Bacilli bacterium]|nr:hypothetical protein [Clostridia bacterium]MBR4618021.1 hypothetical protein [Bacilli bacterium]